MTKKKSDVDMNDLFLSPFGLSDLIFVKVPGQTL